MCAPPRLLDCGLARQDDAIGNGGWVIVKDDAEGFARGIHFMDEIAIDIVRPEFL